MSATSTRQAFDELNARLAHPDFFQTPAEELLSKLNIQICCRIEDNVAIGNHMTKEDFALVMDYAKEIMLSNFDEYNASCLDD